MYQTKLNCEPISLRSNKACITHTGMWFLKLIMSEIQTLFVVVNVYMMTSFHLIMVKILRLLFVQLKSYIICIGYMGQRAWRIVLTLKLSISKIKYRILTWFLLGMWFIPSPWSLSNKKHLLRLLCTCGSYNHCQSTKTQTLIYQLQIYWK